MKENEKEEHAGAISYPPNIITLSSKGSIMLIKASKLNHLSLMALDGQFGKIDQVYFDDHHWTIRFLVVKTGGFLNRKEVLISPIAIKNIDLYQNIIHINLSKKQIEESPDIDTEKPVSRKHEKDYYSYFNWPSYWGDDRIDPWLLGPYGIHWKYLSELYHPEKDQDVVETEALQNQELAKEKEQASNNLTSSGEDYTQEHLRSTRKLRHYQISALDGEFGHVEDFIFDGRSWKIRYIEVDTVNWLPSKSVLISPDWLSGISWQDKKVLVDFPQDIIKNAPSFKEEDLNRQYEELLFSYYNQPPYWLEEDFPKGTVPINQSEEFKQHEPTEELLSPQIKKINKLKNKRETGHLTPPPPPS